MVSYPVLVLNQNYEPLNICRARRAVSLLIQGKVEILENGRGLLRSAQHIIPLPSVVRLVYMIQRPYLRRRLTRLEIFTRDKFTCQYCGKQNKDLTIDHVVPRHQGGQHKWDNVVTACIPCNHHKAGHTPAEARMLLLHPPRVPHAGFAIPYSYLPSPEEWQKYLPGG
ncbi:MAG: endonuclease [Dehalococcoidia bacterium]|nr:endonuclease [Dehalococcoidia bacterium]